jgi:AcrR family transcriptional regulator
MGTRQAVNPHDPRIQRTIKLLGDALIELCIEKGYNNITIQDITDRANVSRTTFYLHFKTVDDLLFARMQVMYDELTALAHELNWGDMAQIQSTMCDPFEFEHVERYLQFYKVMLSDKGSIGFLLRVMDYLAVTYETVLRATIPPDVTPNIPLPILAAIASGAEIGVIRWWVANDLPRTASEMARLLYDAHANSLWWALGIENGQKQP